MASLIFLKVPGKNNNNKQRKEETKFAFQAQLSQWGFVPLGTAANSLECKDPLLQ